MKSIVLGGVFLLLSLQPASVDAQAAAKEPGKANGPVRIALVSSGTGESINALLDLAHAKVSMQSGVELLDRQAMTRILQEQKLSLSGLVDANTAVTAGKLLSVDLFALVEADPAGKGALGLMPPQDDLRTSLYQFLFAALDQWPYPNPDQKYQERFALVDFMLDRHEVVLSVVLNIAVGDLSAKDQWHSQRWELSERTLKLLEAGTPQLCDSANYLKFQLREVQKKILTERPDLAQKLTPAAALWSQADLLLKLKDHPAPNQLGMPVIDGQDIYMAGAGTEKGNYVLRLLRISLKDKSSQVLGKAILRPAPKREQTFAFGQITATSLGKDHVFVGTNTDGLYAFDRAGGAGKLISKDLPSQGIEAMTYHDGRLYVALRGGYLIALDPASGDYETLASSRRRERLSPFDDTEVFRIPYLVADSQRKRLLFLLYQKPNHLIYYSSVTIPPKDTTNGLWEYDLKTKTFKRHLELYFDTFLWGSPIRDGHVLLSKTGYHRTGVMDFDLASNKGNLLWALLPIGPNLPKESARNQEDYYPFSNVQLLRGNWLWCVHPFSRASLTERKHESLPALDELPATYSYSGLCLEPIGTDQWLLSNPSGLWLLKLAKAN